MVKLLTTLAFVLLTASVASAACGCGYAVASPVVYGPTPVVVNYAPAYTYSTYYPYTAYSYPTSYVVASPVVAAPVVYPAPYYTYYGYYGRPWLYVPGQPVRNVLRATFR